MNNDEQPVEASARPSLEAKTEPKDNINALVADLHTVILLHVSLAYLLDNFSILYLLRIVSQGQIANGGIRVVLTANLLCLLTHTFHKITQPAPREFWNHGGLLIDFVGEKPTTRLKLLLLDFLIIALQILYLALYYKKATVDGSVAAKTPLPAQDLEAEEAGISRADPPVSVDETADGIEMQNLLPRNESSGASQAPEDNVVILRKGDFREVFLNTARTTDSDESTARFRLLLSRLNAIRTRRDAQEAAQETAP